MGFLQAGILHLFVRNVHSLVPRASVGLIEAAGGTSPTVFPLFFSPLPHSPFVLLFI